MADPSTSTSTGMLSCSAGLAGHRVHKRRHTMLKWSVTRQQETIVSGALGFRLNRIRLSGVYICSWALAVSLLNPPRLLLAGTFLYHSAVLADVHADIRPRGFSTSAGLFSYASLTACMAARITSVTLPLCFPGCARGKRGTYELKYERTEM